MEAPLNFFHSFPVIERLNLTGNNYPEAEHQVSGVLTMLAEEYFFVSGAWSQDALKKVSSLHLAGQDGVVAHERHLQ